MIAMQPAQIRQRAEDWKKILGQGEVVEGHPKLAAAACRRNACQLSC